MLGDRLMKRFFTEKIREYEPKNLTEAQSSILAWAVHGHAHGMGRGEQLILSLCPQQHVIKFKTWKI